MKERNSTYNIRQRAELNWTVHLYSQYGDVLPDTERITKKKKKFLFLTSNYKLWIDKNTRPFKNNMWCVRIHFVFSPSYINHA